MHPQFYLYTSRCKQNSDVPICSTSTYCTKKNMLLKKHRSKPPEATNRHGRNVNDNIQYILTFLCCVLHTHQVYTYTLCPRIVKRWAYYCSKCTMTKDAARRSLFSTRQGIFRPSYASYSEGGGQSRSQTAVSSFDLSILCLLYTSPSPRD